MPRSTAVKPAGRNDNTAWRNARRRAIRNAGGRCQHCGQPLDPSAPPRTPNATEVDHITPLSHGGHPYDLSNLRALHRRCHQKITAAVVYGTPAATFVGWRDGNYYCEMARCCPHSEKW